MNGTLVTHSNHIEVVKLIKCESCWAETLNATCYTSELLWLAETSVNLTFSQLFKFNQLTVYVWLLILCSHPPPPHSAPPPPPPAPAPLLSAAGSYVALTVLGRPPGLSHVRLEEEEEEEEEKEKGAEVSSLSAPNSPVLSGVEQSGHMTCSSSCSHQEATGSSLPDGVRLPVCTCTSGVSYSNHLITHL